MQKKTLTASIPAALLEKLDRDYPWRRHKIIEALVRAWIAADGEMQMNMMMACVICRNAEKTIDATSPLADDRKFPAEVNVMGNVYVVELLDRDPKIGTDVFASLANKKIMIGPRGTLKQFGEAVGLLTAHHAKAEADRPDDDDPADAWKKR